MICLYQPTDGARVGPVVSLLPVYFYGVRTREESVPALGSQHVY